MDDLRSPWPIALLVDRRPPWAHRGSGLVWCETGSELAVLARAGRVRAAVVDALLAGLDTELLALIRRSGVVVVIDGRDGAARRWQATATSVVGALPADEASLVAAVEEAESAARTWVRPNPPRPPAALITVLAAPGGDGTGTATSLARSLATTRDGSSTVVLADLTLDAPHRALHGFAPDRPGLPDLVEAGRFGPPPATSPRAGHLTTQGYRLVPGLLRHHDWVMVGDHAAERALDAVRTGADLVVAHVDRDLEGETDTGSFDIEDRNVLARTAVRAADLVAVAAGSDRSGRLGAIGTLGALARFGVPHERIIVVFPGGRWSVRRGGRRTSNQILTRRDDGRPDPRLSTAILAHLDAASSVREREAPARGAPQPIVPGTLGHWGQDIDGWITPRVPQQP